MTSITTKNFGSQLTAMKNADGNQRERLQGLLVFAVEHARGNSNSFNYLDRVITACYDLTVGRPTIMRDFIQYLVQGVKLTRVKGSDERRFKKETKGTKIRYTFSNPDDIPNWWQWDAERKKDKVSAPFDLEKRLKALAKQAKSKGATGSAADFRRQVESIIIDPDFGAIFADEGTTVKTAE